MAKKAELEHAHAGYRRSCEAVARHESALALHDAVREAVASLPLVHPAFTFQRRFLKGQEPEAPTLDALFRYAPPLFLRPALDAARQWYLGGSRAERNAMPDVPMRLENAEGVLRRATELWSALAAAPEARLRLDGGHPGDPELVATWLNVGAVVNTARSGPFEYARLSDPRRVARGKCAGCGHLLALPLTRLLDPFPCPACRKPSHFVVVARPV